MTRLTRLLVGLLLAARALPALATFGPGRAISDPAPAVADFFGGAVALSGDRIAVGARFDDPGGTPNAGAAYAFDATSSVAGDPLVAPARAAGDQLGFAVALLGGDVLVAAPGASDHAGAVYRFSGAPVRTYATGVAGGQLGWALAADGADVVAGAPYDGSAGAAYVFDADAGTTRLRLANPTPQADDLFGRAVAIAGGVVVVGAPFDDAGAVNAGVVHCFDRRTGAFMRTLAAPEPHAGDGFGTALVTDGRRIAVGSPFAQTVFVFDAGDGTLLRTIAGPAADTRFGAALALAGDEVLVGAPFADGDVTDAGTAYVYDANDGSLLATLASPSAHAGDQFGAAVAFDGVTAVVGAWLDGTGADNAGSVYVFVDASPPATVPTTTSTSVTSTTSTSATSSTQSTSTSTWSSTESTSVASTTSTSATSTSEGTLEPPSATSTATVSSSVSTTPGAPSTTIAPPCDAGCDDGDPCTADTCGPDGCAHAERSGIDAVACRLDRLDAMLHGPRIATPGLTRRLQRRLAHTRVLVERARRTPATPSLRRSQRTLAAFIALVKRAQRTGALAHATAETLLELSTDAAAQLAPLR